MSEQQPWTEAEVAFVRQKLDEGQSLKDIARALFRTKSAVCGLKKRRGWSAARATQAQPEPERPPKPAPVRVTLPVPQPVEPPPPPVRAGGCMYPRGSKPHWDWCGEPVIENGPYCAMHRRICWIVPPRRTAA